jgi:hypothetical protein
LAETPPAYRIVRFAAAQTSEMAKVELRADPNYLLFRGCGVLRRLDDGWRPAFFVPGIVSAAGDEISMSVNISSKARSAGPGGALARSWSP